MERIKLILVLLLFGLVSCNQSIEEQVHIIDSECDVSVEQQFLTDSIISKFELESKNENVRSNFADIIESTLATLEKSKMDRKLLWPYSKIDSAHYELYELFDGNMKKHDLENRELKKVIKLCDKKTTAILNLMNNPNYFSYGECGTAIPEAQIRFYKEGNVFGKIIFACSHGQTSSTPENTLNKFGEFNEQGNELLDIIKPWQ